MRVGLVGAGRMGREHLKAFALVPEVEVVGVTDRSVERAREVAQQHGIERVYEDFEALIASDDVDAVDVVTPPGAMPEIVLAGCAHAKPILCEKPLGANEAQARAMWEAASNAGITHALCHQRRYDPVHRYVRSLVAEGFIGSPLLVAVQVMTDFGRGKGPGGWVRESEMGGGFFLQVLSHYIDLLRFTFGEVAMTSRDTAAAPPAEGGVPSLDGDDIVAMVGELPGGGRVSLVGSWSLHHPAGVLWQIHGTEGTLHITTHMRILGGRAGDPLRDLGLPDEYVPSLGAEMFSPYEERGSMGWGDNTPMLASLAAEFAGQVAGTAKADPIYATFGDGLRFHEAMGRAAGGPGRLGRAHTRPEG